MAHRPHRTVARGRLSGALLREVPHVSGRTLRPGLRCNARARAAGDEAALQCEGGSAFRDAAAPMAEVGASGRQAPTTRFATVTLSPPPVSGSMLGGPPQPLLFATSAVVSVAALATATRGLFRTSRAEAEQLLKEVEFEMRKAGKIVLPLETELHARAEATLQLAQAAQAQALLGTPASATTLRTLSASVVELQHNLLQQQQQQQMAPGQVQDAGLAPALGLLPEAASTGQGEGQATAPSPPGGQPAAAAAAERMPDGKRLQQIMSTVQSILTVLEQHEQQHAARLAAGAAAAAPSVAEQTDVSVGSTATTAPAFHQPQLHHVAPAPDAPTAEGTRIGVHGTAGAAVAPRVAGLAPAAESVPSLWGSTVAASSHGHLAPQASARPSLSPSHPSTAPPAPQLQPVFQATPPSFRPEQLWALPPTELKFRLLDAVYGTARGVGADQEQRAWVEELVCALEGQNPHPMVTDALHVLHGRWKLIYTNNHATLTLLTALQSVPLVDVGDVYQMVDGTTLTAHNKIDLALPVILSLRADSGLEVRSPHSFKIRFHNVGVDTYVKTPQLLVSLQVPESVEVLGHTVDLEPLRRHIIQPMQSGLSQAQELLRRASRPEVGLPAMESNALWMMTTYLDDTLRISRDDAGATFVMLKDV